MNELIVVKAGQQAFPVQVAIRAYLLSIGMSGTMAQDLSLRLADVKLNRRLPREKNAFRRRLTCAIRTTRFLLRGPSKLSDRVSKVRGLRQVHRRQLIVQDIVPKKAIVVREEEARSAVMSLARIIQGDPQYLTWSFLYDRMIDYWTSCGNLTHVNAMSHRLKKPLDEFSDSIPSPSKPEVIVGPREADIPRIEGPKKA